MTRASKTVLALVVASGLAACAGGGGYVSAGVGGPVYYDGYYDGHYGHFYDGYWGDDDFFYYAPHRGRPFVRDNDHHFRRDAAAGFNSFHHAHVGPHTNHMHEPNHS